MSSRQIDVSGPRLRILRVALAHWARALKRVSSRVQGMGYPGTAAAMREDRERIKGSDHAQGLLERLNPQANLLEDDDEKPTNGHVPLDRDELRISYFAVRKHRERILDLKRKNEKEEYETDEQDRDLELIGEPRGDDGQPSTGFLSELDLGWEDEEADPDQITMYEATPEGAGAAAAPVGASVEEADDEEEIEEDLSEHIQAFCRRKLEENPDLENRALFDQAVEAFPGAGLEDLTLRQFHARYPLQVKRAMAKDGSES